MGSHAAIYASEERPEVIAPTFAGVSPVLRAERRWVLWRLEWRGSWSKVPYSVAGYRASSVNPETWSDFTTIQAAYERGGYDGIGFMLGDGWAGVDLDDCRDSITAKLKPWAKKILRRIGGYAEVSPSGTGVKVFGRGQRVSDQSLYTCEDGSVEIYDGGRYFCVTGQSCGEVADIADSLRWLDSTLAATSKSVARPRTIAGCQSAPWWWSRRLATRERRAASNVPRLQLPSAPSRTPVESKP